MPNLEDEELEVQKYSLDYLSENSKIIFGVNIEVLAGALYGIECDEFTVDEVKHYIENFMNKKVLE